MAPGWLVHFKIVIWVVMVPTSIYPHIAVPIIIKTTIKKMYVLEPMGKRASLII
jgi:hypothetical protein